MGTQLPVLKSGQSPNITFGPCLLWPNGWMNQYSTWCSGGPRSNLHCARWGPSSPSPKGAHPPIFGPCLLWSNGWVDQDVTWYGGRPRPRRRCVRWGPSSPSKGHSSTPVFGPCVSYGHDGSSQLLLRSYENQLRLGGVSVPSRVWFLFWYS